MCFSNEDSNEYRLLRLCDKYNTIILDGDKKILNYFINTYNPKSITTYCDMSKFTGNRLDVLGFDLIEYIEPSIIGYSNIKMIQEDIDTIIGKYNKMYDCGISVYRLT